MKIGVWPALLEFFDFLSQKLIRTTHQNSHQTCKEVKQQPTYEGNSYNRIELQCSYYDHRLSYVYIS